MTVVTRPVRPLDEQLQGYLDHLTIERGVAANTLWPRTTIATAAVRNLLGGDELVAISRKPDIYADAAWHVLVQPAAEYSGHTLIVEDVLAEAGITDLSGYAQVPGTPDEALFPDIFL